jgi:Flp pilus assembly protein TadG
MLFARFMRDREGSLLPLFAVSLIPMFGLIGAVIDYSRASAVRAELQASLDSAAIMLSREAKTLTEAQIQTKASEYVQASFNRPDIGPIAITPAFTQADGTFTLKIAGTASLPVRFVNLIGQSNLTVSSSTEVTWGTRRLELALALDNTGSMASANKMTELKTATKTLLETLKKAATKPDSVKVSIVPFATDVNIGSGSASETWLDWSTFDSSSVPGVSCYGSSCYSGGAWVPKRSLWNGCVWDRAQEHDVKDTAPSGTATYFQPHQASNCPVSVLPLTNDWTALNAKVDAMTPVGATNVTIGLAWGWHMLTLNDPFTQAAAPKEDLDKVIILLTDGENTRNRWNGDGSTPCASCDERTKLACANVKAENIKLYTVRVIDGNATLLKNCATRPDMYFDVQNASQLNAVFTRIAENLASLRIAK